MNNHLSQDQLSMCILGRATPEEQRHGRECPECNAELARFQEPLATFRAAMQDWSDRENVPRLAQVSDFLSRPRRFSNPVWGWVPAAMAVMIVVLTAIPIYVQQRNLQETQAEEAVRRDALLIDAVNLHLSRTLPTPMEPILALVPDRESFIQPGGTQ
jgi:anti-sigma factor RsiW